VAGPLMLSFLGERAVTQNDQRWEMMGNVVSESFGAVRSRGLGPSGGGSGRLGGAAMRTRQTRSVAIATWSVACQQHGASMMVNKQKPANAVPVASARPDQNTPPAVGPCFRRNFIPRRPNFGWANSAQKRSDQPLLPSDGWVAPISGKPLFLN